LLASYGAFMVNVEVVEVEEEEEEEEEEKVYSELTQ